MFIPFKNLVPLAAPNKFYHVPAGSVKPAFQFLDDLAVSPDRTVKSLEIAVDNKDQVVELFPGGERQGAE